MSTVKTNNVQIGQSVTATNNFTWYQPSTPDGTVRLGNGNSGSVTDLVTLTSAGNLGIGTASPIDKFHVAGGVTSTALSAPSNTSIGSVQLGYDGTNGVLRTWNSSPLRFDTAGVQRLLIDSSGNLGLGVTPPSGATSNGMYFGSAGSVIGLGNGLQLAGNTYWDGAWKYRVSSIPANRIDINAGNVGAIGFFTAPSGTAGAAASFTQAMTLDASGNLLVGTTSASGSTANSAKLVAGQMKTAAGAVNSSSTATTMFSLSTVGVYYVSAMWAASNASAFDAFAVILYDGSSARIALSSNGSQILISLSGTNVQLTNNYNTAQVNWSYMVQSLT